MLITGLQQKNQLIIDLTIVFQKNLQEKILDVKFQVSKLLILKLRSSVNALIKAYIWPPEQSLINHKFGNKTQMLSFRVPVTKK